MGHNSGRKKKKKKNKAKGFSKDHSSDLSDFSDVISEEFTALCAIFQEDCTIISESPPQVSIMIRPYSKDTGYVDLNVSALLLVQCLSGYPYKSPKLLIVAKQGLAESDANTLLSLLYNQANANAREGRVMIFNLAEAAQEFLSEIVPAVSLDMDNKSQLLLKGVSLSPRINSVAAPFVYGFVDLFCDSGESWHVSLGSDDSSKLGTSEHSQLVSISKQVYEGVEKNFLEKVEDYSRSRPIISDGAILDTHEEKRQNDNKSLSTTHPDMSSSDDSIGYMKNGSLSRQRVHLDEPDDAVSGSDSPSSSSMMDDPSSDILERELLMAHLLRMACGSKGPLADVLPDLVSELHNIGVLSGIVRNLVMKPSSLYNKRFYQLFDRHMATTRFRQFWEPVLDFESQRDSSRPSSRYLNDFEEIRSLGHGGFGHVMLCKNKLDGRHYAVKMIRLKGKGLPLDDRILREVATLARLQHQHVVRYYQAWFEIGTMGYYEDSTFGSRTAVSSIVSFRDGSSTCTDWGKDAIESTFLYIQMEYCPRTLRQLFESYTHFDKDLAWHLFRQVVEGLAHIHGHGIIHRDLTPNNIFFDARNDIKIGDFGLAKFLKREQLEQDQTCPTEALGVSADGTGRVGTYFYTAPEIEQGWPKIDEKADMYSLGVVFLELWHPFGTAMERHAVLSDLKLKKVIPESWDAEFPEQALLLRRLMSSSPSDRPSATELLQHAFPPRMEYQLLDKFLRTMQTSEDTSIYDKVVSSIFDEEMLTLRSNHHQAGRLELAGVEPLNPLVDTELRDHVVGVCREVFRRHCAKHLETASVRPFDESLQIDRNTVKLLTDGGDVVELCHELRSPFMKWIVANQRLSFKRYDISCVYRKGVGHSAPNRYLQGDFDIIGGASALTEAEAIKVTMDILVYFFHSDSCDIHLNHGRLLEAIWCWTGVKPDQRLKVAELLSLMGSLRPQSAERKSRWVVIRRQLLQELNLAEGVVNRLQTVSLRFCAVADQALPRLRGALLADTSTGKALDELSELFNHLGVWKVQKNVFIDALMPPTECYHKDLFFQVYIRKGSPGPPADGSLLAVGGRYDHKLREVWKYENRSSPPGGVGLSLALETIIKVSSWEFRPLRNEASVNVLVCSRGGGGLLEERMELAAELWESNIKADFVPSPEPSLTEQYEYANENDIKCLVIIMDSGFAQKDSVRVRHLELKREKEVDKEHLVRFLLNAMASQFRNPSIWN